MSEAPSPWRRRLTELAERYGLAPGVEDRLAALVEYVAGDPHAPTSIREPREVVDQHVADSLAGLDVFSGGAEVLDIGSGAGFPGLALALARPESAFVLLDSAGRKCEFMRGAARTCGAGNVEVVHARAEAWPAGRDRFAVVTARALAGLDVVLEYAAPLLAVGGTLVAWRGRRSPEEERAAERAASVLGMEVREILEVTPFPVARSRHLHLISKVVKTPSGFPRRPGVAAKRPLGAAS